MAISRTKYYVSLTSTDLPCTEAIMVQTVIWQPDATDGVLQLYDKNTEAFIGPLTAMNDDIKVISFVRPIRVEGCKFAAGGSGTVFLYHS